MPSSQLGKVIISYGKTMRLIQSDSEESSEESDSSDEEEQPKPRRQKGNESDSSEDDRTAKTSALKTKATKKSGAAVSFTREEIVRDEVSEMRQATTEMMKAMRMAMQSFQNAHSVVIARRSEHTYETPTPSTRLRSEKRPSSIDIYGAASRRQHPSVLENCWPFSVLFSRESSCLHERGPYWLWEAE